MAGREQQLSRHQASGDGYLPRQGHFISNRKPVSVHGNFESGRRFGSAVSRYDEQTGLHVTEATILIDHVDLTQGALKVLPKIECAQGYSVFPVPAEFVLDESLEVFDLEPVYDRKTEVELLRLQENVYKIQLKWKLAQSTQGTISGELWFSYQ